MSEETSRKRTWRKCPGCDGRWVGWRFLDGRVSWTRIHVHFTDEQLAAIANATANATDEQEAQ